MASLCAYVLCAMFYAHISRPPDFSIVFYTSKLGLYASIYGKNMFSNSRLDFSITWGLVPSFAKPPRSMLPDAMGERTGRTANVGAAEHTSKFINSAACLGLSPPIF